MAHSQILRTFLLFLLFPLCFAILPAFRLGFCNLVPKIKINNKLCFVVNLCTYENEQRIKNGCECREYEIGVVVISNLSVCVKGIEHCKFYLKFKYFDGAAVGWSIQNE